MDRQGRGPTSSTTRHTVVQLSRSHLTNESRVGGSRFTSDSPSPAPAGGRGRRSGAAVRSDKMHVRFSNHGRAARSCSSRARRRVPLVTLLPCANCVLGQQAHYCELSSGGTMQCFGLICALTARSKDKLPCPSASDSAGSGHMHAASDQSTTVAKRGDGRLRGP